VNRASMLRKEQLTLNAFCGGISEIEILWDTNFDVSIRLAATYWISIVRRQSELDGGGHNYRLGQMRDKSRSNVLAD
jgi:hypothetical protein